jgi:acyl dehydratase
MQYLEDFAPGQRFTTPSRAITPENIRDFAARYDPQPFHIDDDAAGQSMFGRLVASGWQTASVTMRLMVDSDFSPANGIVGFKVEDLSWKEPVVPGDSLHAVIEVLSATPSRSKPDRGVLRILISTNRQDGVTVQQMTANLMVLCRPA